MSKSILLSNFDDIIFCDHRIKRNFTILIVQFIKLITTTFNSHLIIMWSEINKCE